MTLQHGSRCARRLRMPLVIWLGLAISLSGAIAQEERIPDASDGVNLNKPAHFQIWRTITLGTYKGVDAYRRALDSAGIKIGDAADEILGRPGPGRCRFPWKHGRKAMSIATAFAEAPTYEDLIARGHALVPDFADRAARCESDCRVSDESVEQFRETGLHKTLLPAAYGGYEMGFSALLETSFSIGKVCASSAWVCGLYMVHNWLGGLFPKKAQDELWGRDSDTFISGSYAPIGKATSVEGGYLLSGDFRFPADRPGQHGISAGRCCR